MADQTFAYLERHSIGMPSTAVMTNCIAHWRNGANKTRGNGLASVLYQMMHPAYSGSTRRCWNLWRISQGAIAHAAATRRSRANGRKEIGKDGIPRTILPSDTKRKTDHVPLSQAVARGYRGPAKNRMRCDYVFRVACKDTLYRLRQEQAKLDKGSLADTTVDPIPNWTLHDLRRTAKSLMARAGVRPDISERVLGHVIAGVEGVYDRHSYLEEKRDALEKLAAMIERILNPLPANVEQLGEHRSKVQS